MKSVLIVVGSSNVGGAEKQSLILGKNLSRRFRVAFVFLGKPGSFLNSKIESDFPTYISSGSIYSDLSVLSKALRETKPSALINFLYRADLLGGLLGCFYRVPKILNSARNTEWPNVTPLKKLVLSIAARLIPDVIVANSSQSADWHSQIGYPTKKMLVIPNYLDLSLAFSTIPKSYSFHTPLRLGIASRPVSGKGHVVLIQAIQRLMVSGIPAEAWFIGFGVPEWVKSDPFLKSNLSLINAAEGTLNLEGWFREIDIYCGVSESWESDSNSVNEAVLAEKSIVISKLIGTHDFVPPPKFGEVRDGSSLCEAVLTILQTKEDDREEEVTSRRRNLISRREPDLVTSYWYRALGI